MTEGWRELAGGEEACLEEGGGGERRGETEMRDWTTLERKRMTEIREGGEV